LNQAVEINPEEILPEAPAILCQQGVPAYAAGDPQLLAVAQAAAGELRRTLAPAGVLAGVSIEEFAAIYPGQGFNARLSPLATIFPRADRLALFAVTCGQGVCDRIGDLFFKADYALGAALDAAASLAADQAAQVVQDRLAAAVDGRLAVLRYSPGYCGWHVSGQKRLFAHLGSRSAGITLNDSFLMRPLKSVSGVVVAGSAEIHQFENDYRFCSTCTDKECLERMQSVLPKTEGDT
jgi:hypothetical protein